MHDGPGGSGTSRLAIMEQIDASLRRLDTDYIDLYQIHRVDPEVPFEETMQALDDVVRAGKVRYIGASNAAAWQFAKMQSIAEQHGWTRFVSVQHQYNLLFREEEREMFPLLRHEGAGSLPWSPLGRGRLARPWGTETSRSDTDALGRQWFADAESAVVDAVERVADQRGIPMAQVALAWALRNPAVSAPIVGATKAHHLTDAVAALDLELSDDEVATLEEHYRPRNPLS